GRDHRAFTAEERRQRLVLSALVREQSLLAPIGEVLDVLHLHRAVELQLGAQAAEAVLLAPEPDVMPCTEALELYPRLPARGKGEACTARLELLHRLRHLRPGLRWALRIETGFFERVVVDVEHLGRAVERHRQQLALRVGVVTVDGADESLRIELLAGF